MSGKVGFHPQTVQRRGQHRIDHKGGSGTADTQQATQDERSGDAGAAGIHSPAAFKGYLAVQGQIIVVMGDIPIRESRIGTRIVAIGLPSSRRSHHGLDADRHGAGQGLQERLAIANTPKRLRVTKMRMHVHVADFTTEETAAFGPLEQGHRSAPIGHGSIKQVSAVGSMQMRGNQVQMPSRLVRSKHVIDDGMDHGQKTVGEPGFAVTRVQQIVDGAITLEIGVAGKHTVDQQVAPEIGEHLLGKALENPGWFNLADTAQGLSQRGQHLIMQGDGPGAAQAFTQRRVGRLQRVVPIAMSVGRETGIGYHPPVNQFQRPLDMPPKTDDLGLGWVGMKERNGFLQD